MSKYITSIMKRIKISEEMYIFHYDRLVVGELEEESGLFIDQDGNKYYKTTTKGAVEGDSNYSYGIYAEIEEVKNKLGENYLEKFENQIKNKMIIVQQQAPGDYCKYTLDLEPTKQEEPKSKSEEQLLRQYYEQLFKMIKENINSYSLEELKNLNVLLEEENNIIKQVIERMIVEKTPKKKTRKKHLNINDLYNKVTETVIAQDVPIRRVIVEIESKERNPLLKRKGILLTGNRGVGKKELIRQIAKYLDKPLLEIDATQLLLLSYSGKALEEYLWDLYTNCGFDIEKAEQAIVYIDGIDKKGIPNKYNLSGQFVLNDILPFIEGETYVATDSIDSQFQTVSINTSKMIKIFGGTFSQVYNNLRVNNSYGFGIANSSKEKYRKATTQDFIKYSLMTEAFMAKNSVIRMNDLEKPEFIRILLESNESPLLIQKKLFKEAGVDITFTEDYINLIAEKNQKMKAGGGGLFSLVEDSVWMAYEEVISNPKKYKDKKNLYEVVITQDTIDDPSQFIINELKEKTYKKLK